MGTLLSSNQTCQNCGSSRGLATYTDGSICFSCDWVSNAKLRPLLLQAETNSFKNLPEDTEFKLPEEAILWLKTMGLDRTDVSKYILGWSATYRGIVIPIINKTSFDGIVIRRKLFNDTQGAKTLTYTKPNTLYTLLHNKSNILVLVEDCFSAMKVHKAGFSAVALLGTHVNYSKMLKLEDTGLQSIRIWLDPDKAGQTAAKQIELKLYNYFCDIKLINSEKDPKAHSLEEIREILL